MWRAFSVFPFRIACDRPAPPHRHHRREQSGHDQSHLAALRLSPGRLQGARPAQHHRLRLHQSPRRGRTTRGRDSRHLRRPAALRRHRRGPEDLRRGPPHRPRPRRWPAGSVRARSRARSRSSRHAGPRHLPGAAGPQRRPRRHADPGHSDATSPARSSTKTGENRVADRARGGDRARHEARGTSLHHPGGRELIPPPGREAHRRGSRRLGHLARGRHRRRPGDARPDLRGGGAVASRELLEDVARLRRTLHAASSRPRTDSAQSRRSLRSS